MAPSQNYVLNTIPLEPVSRTYQYRKVMKPMLERKRRARINRCLDELKELMAVALQSEGENVAKLEKADILELTVRHLQTLKEQNLLYVKSSTATTIQKTDKIINDESFWYGFRHCANEVSQYLLRFDHKAGIDFLRYIKDYMPTTNLDKTGIITILQHQQQSNNNKQQYFTTTTSGSVNASTRTSTMSMYSTINAMSHFQSTYNRYHQDDISFLMYRNKMYAQNLNNMPAMMIDNNHIIKNGCSINKDSKDSLSSDVSLDDDITVWRPW